MSFNGHSIIFFFILHTISKGKLNLQSLYSAVTYHCFSSNSEYQLQMNSSMHNFLWQMHIRLCVDECYMPTNAMQNKLTNSRKHLRSLCIPLYSCQTNIDCSLLKMKIQVSLTDLFWFVTKKSLNPTLGLSHIQQTRAKPGAKVNGWILPTGGVASGRVCPAACAAGLFILSLRQNRLNWINRLDKAKAIIAKLFELNLNVQLYNPVVLWRI